MKRYTQSNSLESLVGDLIFKLGKANQRIYSLDKKVRQLETMLQQYVSDSNKFPKAKHHILLKNHL